MHINNPLLIKVDQDTYWNEQHTSNSAKMAVGSMIELADKVVTGEVKVHGQYCFPFPPPFLSLSHFFYLAQSFYSLVSCFKSC